METVECLREGSDSGCICKVEQDLDRVGSRLKSERSKK